MCGGSRRRRGDAPFVAEEINAGNGFPQSGKMQMSHIGMFELLTPAVAGEIPLTHPTGRVAARGHMCPPVAGRAGPIHTNPERAGH